jgi:hypothetical protein
MSFVHGAHGKINLVYIFSAGEVAGDGKGNQDGLIFDLRFAKVADALTEDADDGEGDSADLKVLADGRVIAAKALVGELFSDHGALDMGNVIVVVKEAAHGNQQVADVLILRAYAEDERVPDHA